MGFSRIGIAALAFAVFSLWYACGTPLGPTVEQVQTAEYFREMGKANNYYLEQIRPSILKLPEIGRAQTDYRLRNQEEAVAIERIVPKLGTLIEMMKKAVPPPKLQEHHTVNIEGMETQISIFRGIIEALRQSDAEAFHAAKKKLDEFTLLSMEQNQLALRKAGFNSIEDVKAALKIKQEESSLTTTMNVLLLIGLLSLLAVWFFWLAHFLIMLCAAPVARQLAYIYAKAGDRLEGPDYVIRAKQYVAQQLRDPESSESRLAAMIDANPRLREDDLSGMQLVLRDILLTAIMRHDFLKEAAQLVTFRTIFRTQFIQIMLLNLSRWLALGCALVLIYLWAR